MAHYKMSDVAVEVNDRENNPANSQYERFVGLEHYVSGEVIIRNYGSTQNLESTMKIFQSGDVLVARRNVYLKRAATVDFDGLTSGDSIVLRAKNPVIGRILPFVLNTDAFWDFADQYSDGTMSKRLSPKTLMTYEFDLPNEDELESFADLLWAANDARESYQELLRQTDELVKSQFIELFNGNQHPVKRLEEVSIVTSGLTKNSKRSAMQIKMKYLRVANVLFNELDLSDVQEIGVEEREIEKSLLQKNDLLFVEGNGSPDQIGRVSLWDGSIAPILHQNHLIKARFNGTVLPEYAMYYFMSDEGRKQILLSASTTSGLYTLSTGKIAAFELPIPPLTLQKKFLELTKQTDKSKFEIKKAIENTSALIKSLMQQDLST